MMAVHRLFLPRCFQTIGMCLLVSAIAGVPYHGSADSSQVGEIVETYDIPGHQWHAWRVRLAQADDLALEAIGSPQNATVFAWGFWAWRDGGSADPEHDLGYVRKSGVQAHAQVGGPLNTAVSVSENPSCDILADLVKESLPDAVCWFGSGLFSFVAAEAGDWIVVAATAVDGAWNGTLSFRVDSPGASIVGHQNGSALLALDKDYTGLLNVGLDQGPLFSGAKVMIDTKIERSFGGTVFGYFLGETATGWLEMGYDILSTGETFDGGTYYRLTHSPPGHYRFRVEQVDATVFPLPSTHTTLLVAGVVVPPS